MNTSITTTNRFALPAGHSPTGHMTVYDFPHWTGGPFTNFSMRAEYHAAVEAIRDLYAENGFIRDDAELYAIPMFRHGTWTAI